MAGGAVCCVALWFVTSVISAFLLGYSFDTLPPTLMAFRFNRNTMRLDEGHLYNSMPGASGRFFVGLGQGFDYEFTRLHNIVRFDVTPDSVEGPIYALSNEGASVQMSISFIYRLPTTAADLLTVFKRFGTNYQFFVNQYVRAASLNVIGDVSVFHLFQNRSDVKARMTTELTSALALHSIVLNSVQVLDIEIPTALKNAIELTTVIQQNVLQAQFAQNAAFVAATTLRVTTEQQAVIGVQNANSTAIATVTLATANANAKLYTIGQESVAYANVSETLSLNSSSLLTYMWIDAMTAANATSTLVGVAPSSAAFL